MNGPLLNGGPYRRIGRGGARSRSARALVAALVGVLAVCTYAPTAGANPVSFKFPAKEHFVELQLNGSAKVGETKTGEFLRLTTAACCQAGSAFDKTEISTERPFQTHFVTRIQETTTYPADGMVFVLQPSSAKALGGTGGALGYAGSSEMKSSIGVFIRLCCNLAGQPTTPYIALAKDEELNERLAISGAPLSFPFYNATANVWIEYDGSTLSVYAAPNIEEGKPAAPLFTYPLDLKEVLGNSSLAYAGFTAATGEGDTEQRINEWTLSGEVAPFAPTVATEPATEVTTTSATLNATVNPESQGTECIFEYGTTTAYNKTAPCPPPGSGESPVPVSAQLSGLTPDTTYHFRVSAANAQGESTGRDATFTTLGALETGETTKKSKPAEAKLGQISVKASGGTGAVTVGTYGSDVGGPGLPKSAGKYFDVYRSRKSKFKTIEIKDCELGEATSLSWYSAAGTWERLTAPPAVRSGECITVTLTQNTWPSVAQLLGTRFGTRFGDSSSSEFEYGECLLVAGGLEPGCDFNSGVGKYQWYPVRPQCYAVANGHYKKENKKGECEGTAPVKKGTPKGKYEKGAIEAFSGSTATSNSTPKLEMGTLGTLECADLTTNGRLAGPKAGNETMTFGGCKLNKGANQEPACVAPNKGQAITTPPEMAIEIEDEEYEESGAKHFYGPTTEFGGKGQTFVEFECEKVLYKVTGGVRGVTTGNEEKMSASSETKFKKVASPPHRCEEAKNKNEPVEHEECAYEQELAASAGGGTPQKAFLTASESTTYTNQLEIRELK